MELPAVISVAEHPSHILAADADHTHKSQLQPDPHICSFCFCSSTRILYRLQPPKDLRVITWGMSQDAQPQRLRYPNSTLCKFLDIVLGVEIHLGTQSSSPNLEQIRLVNITIFDTEA